ncbi:hypothetical protein CEUSTIGMA_g9944.t1 [Chlamydomonas eustigma]|uniref:EF-hand domain-containing protein n=1 Tax=Chlamydomonas eustigma TaxID=1157962 RepID=A0A250XHG6_9CHLO|nr:hypothetical protein CEUSTIGMA_g9944.t1 [Chlamydomonas eustigma]|eukprot:GAX82517.1 hypothetical protein CEUSTIGMA_g9944.t1 [Chlamydomonas eustigma]
MLSNASVVGDETSTLKENFEKLREESTGSAGELRTDSALHGKMLGVSPLARSTGAVDQMDSSVTWTSQLGRGKSEGGMSKHNSGREPLIRTVHRLRTESGFHLQGPISVGSTSRLSSREAPPLETLEGRSLFLLSPTNPVRKFLHKVTSNVYFEYLMLLLIFVSSLELCFDDSSSVPGTTKFAVLHVMDIFFSITFGVEALMKILALGLLFNGKDSYLRNPWNILDMFVVIVNVLVLALDTLTNPNNIIWLRAFRALRALRPLRVATQLDGIRVVVMAMVKSLPAVGEIFLVGALFFYIFAVLGVNLMCGLFFGCYSNGNLLNPAYYKGLGEGINKTWCEADGGIHNITHSYYHDMINVTVPQWQTSTTWGANGQLARFDNLIMALWVLFWMTSLENWSPIMIQAMDITSTDDQPVFNNNIYITFYFIVFIVIGVYFIMNLVIGVAISTFGKMREQLGRSAMLTEVQQEWLTIQRMLATLQLTKKYKRPSGRFRLSVYRVIMTERFEKIMMCIIIANLLPLFMSYQGESDTWAAGLDVVNVVFTSLYVMEMVLKWISIGLPAYFKDHWCQFDAAVVVFSVTGVIMEYVAHDNLTILTLLRTLRVLRIFKLIPKARGLKMMMMTLLWSLPALMNVGAVLLLCMYIFAIIAMNMFGDMKWYGEIDLYANFESFPTAMFTLFRMQTGENWNYVMTACMNLQQCIQVTNDVDIIIPGNTTASVIYRGTYLDTESDALTLSVVPSDLQNNRCSPAPALAAVFFTVYMGLCTFLVLELVVAVIIENIEYQTKIANMAITQKHIEDFCDAWEELDQTSSGFIDAAGMTTVLTRVAPPMGVKGLDCPSRYIQDIVMSCNIPLRNLKIHFMETLHELTGRVAAAPLPIDEEWVIHDKIVQRLPQDKELPKYTTGDYYSALYVKASIKGFLIRSKLNAVHSEHAAGTREVIMSSFNDPASNQPYTDRCPMLTREEKIAMGLTVRDTDCSLKSSAASSRTAREEPSLQSHTSISTGKSKAARVEPSLQSHTRISTGKSKQAADSSSSSPINMTSEGSSSRSIRLSPQQPSPEASAGVAVITDQETSVPNPVAQSSPPLGEERQDWHREVEGGVESGVELSNMAAGSMNRSDSSLITERLSPPSSSDFQRHSRGANTDAQPNHLSPKRDLTSFASSSSSRSTSPAIRLPKLPGSSSSTRQLDAEHLPPLSLKQRLLFPPDTTCSEGGGSVMRA